MEGRNGLLADSLAVSWAQVRAQTRADDLTVRMSGPRLVPPDEPASSEARNWTLYEAITRTQSWASVETRTVRALFVRAAEVQFGRGRVYDRPYSPAINSQLFPGRTAGVGGNNVMARSRATRFSGTALDAAVLLSAQESPGLGAGEVVCLENYRAWLAEGFPTLQHVPDYAYVFAAAALDVPLAPGAGVEDCTPVPDYAVTLTVDVPQALAVDAARTLCVAWVDVFGVRYPLSLATAADGPAVELGQPLTVPSWASYMHLYTIGAPTTGPVGVTWGLQL